MKFPALIQSNQAQIKLICVHYVCRLELVGTFNCTWQTIRLDTRVTRTNG